MHEVLKYKTIDTETTHTKHRKYFKRQFQLTRCRRVPLGLGRPRADMPRVVASWGSSINYNVSKEIYTHLICMYVCSWKKTKNRKFENDLAQNFTQFSTFETAVCNRERTGFPCCCHCWSGDCDE